MNLIDLVFPKSCLSCKKSGLYICSECVTKVRFPKATCPRCNRPSIDGFTHIKCKRKYGLDGLMSVWNYEGVIRNAILALKYKYATEITKELRGYMTKELKKKEFILKTDYILTPIPLHWYRENKRGFNQSVEVGKGIARDFGWKFAPNLLIRKKFTAPQVTLKDKERQKNIQGAFSFNPDYDLLSTSYIIFDDVYTTGSTLKEAAKALKRKGANKVWGLTIAK